MSNSSLLPQAILLSTSMFHWRVGPERRIRGSLKGDIGCPTSGKELGELRRLLRVQHGEVLSPLVGRPCSLPMPKLLPFVPVRRAVSRHHTLHLFTFSPGNGDTVAFYSFQSMGCFFFWRKVRVSHPQLLYSSCRVEGRGACEVILCGHFHAKGALQ